MKELSLKSIARAVGAKTRADITINSVCTDTRKIIPGCIYVAIKGENFDGHDFAQKAVESGAAAVICERDCGAANQLLVPSTRQALIDLAGYYRSLFKIPVVGITGSVGKTTTKEMTHAVLSSVYNTMKTDGNLNNEIGVPLTIFRLDESYEAAVIEMGMSGFNEISNMTRAAKPDVAIISNIGVSHIEKLGSRENILKAKLEILEGMAPDAPIVLNGDDDLLITADTGTHRAMYFGIDNKNASVKAYDITSNERETEFTVGFGDGSERVCLPSPGRHNILNALAAISAGLLLGIPLDKAAKALREYEPAGMRQRIRQAGGVTVIEDCYNASPDSFKAAFAVLKDLNANRRIAVVGDMLELGSISEQAHRSVGINAAESKVDILLTFGKMAHFIAQEGRNHGIVLAKAFDDKAELGNYLSTVVCPGDAVLFKASRAMRLEDVLYCLYDDIGKEENK